MSHHTAKEAYKKLEERINRFPQGAPPSDTLYKILNLLFSEKEAILVSQLPIKPFTVKTASIIWKISEIETHKILDVLASRAILLDIDNNGVQKYVLPPPMAGFLEFSLMRTRGDIDQKLLSELFHQYLNVEEDFIKELFYSCETRLGRVFVQEKVLSNENAVSILDYERASHIIKTSKDMAVSMCYCRHKMSHLGQACSAPMDICMTFGNVASSLIKHGHARRVDLIEGLELLDEAYENNLVQCGENVQNEVTFICNCCGCCCEAMLAAKKYGSAHPVNTTSFLPGIVENTCTGCGKCAKVCPINCISIEQKDDKKTVVVNHDICLGCGICVRNCPKKSIRLQKRAERIITPVDSVHRLVLMAIEKGQLQNLIFDSQSFASHRSMAAILGAILKLPPIKRAMASKQMKSVYLENLLSRVKI